MKKLLLVAPACLLLTFCSRQTIPPPPSGISNVSVGRGDTMTSAATASAAIKSPERDWTYRSGQDTVLSGTWTLEGMMTADGSWRSVPPPAIAADIVTEQDTALVATGTVGKTNTTKKKNTRALYDSAQARLNRSHSAGSAIDTSAIRPFEYWKRIPVLNIDARRQVFSGNSGCNSMSGPFHFNNSEIQFGPGIVTSKMACNDYDESGFLSALQRADHYMMNEKTLELRQGNTLLLTFRR